MTALLTRLLLCSIGLAASGCTGTEVETSGAPAKPATSSTAMPITDHATAATNRPPIDLDAPSGCQTATFALG